MKVDIDNPEELFNITTLDIGDGDESGPSNFKKIIIALKYLTTSNFYPKQKSISGIFCTFFERLDPISADQAFEIIQQWIKIKPEI